MPITALPTPPVPTDTTVDFNTKAFALLNALPLFVTETNATATDVNTKSGVATGAATAASNSAATAMATANYKGEWSTLSGALNIPASVSRNGQVYILKNNLVNVAASTPGVTADWLLLGGSRLVREARTSNTILTAANAGDFIDITTGTFTQTFDAVTNLGTNWYCYIRNSGTGDVTLDPNASETIDGVTSFVMYPGEARLIQCDGSVLRSLVIQGFTKTFTTSGTFTKPPGYNNFSAVVIGGGGGGTGGERGATATNSRGGGGGGGGGRGTITFPANLIAATVTTTIGAGGAGGAGKAVTGDANPGTSGGTSTLTGVLSATGGIGGGAFSPGTGGSSVSYVKNSGGEGGAGAINNIGSDGRPNYDGTLATGGGGGGGNYYNGNQYAGALGGSSPKGAGGTGGVIGTPNGGVGASDTLLGGSGGGGGVGSNAIGAGAGNGGNGGAGGGGGGGGGGAYNGTSGAGADGGVGAITIWGIF